MSKGPWDVPSGSGPGPHLAQGWTGRPIVDPKVVSEQELAEIERQHAEEEATGHVPWYRRIFRRRS
ncbi:MAG TPA: hypothetical protein VK646_04035 [Actinomycetota bacterium]|nr:hypothetical protein [Actinomycetota bacterium]